MATVMNELANVVQLAWNGVAQGVFYALVALGLGIIFYTTRVLHFAQGGTLLLGSYLIIALSDDLHLPWLAAAALTIPILGVLGAGMELALYRPVRKRFSSGPSLFIVSIGILLLITNLLGYFFGSLTRYVGTSPVSATVVVWDSRLVFQVADLIAVPSFVVLIAAILTYLKFSYTGKCLRGVIDDPTTAAVVGIPLRRYYVGAFILGSAIAVPAATYQVLTSGVNNDTGNDLLVIALAALIVGGLGNLTGALAGGLVIGIVENLSFLAVPSIYGTAVIFCFLLLIIIIRPRGILGGRLTRLAA
jgi:branched-chain amino acid transport system permease protein